MPMRYLEHSALNRLSVLLQRLDVGDRVIEGKLELFSATNQIFEDLKVVEAVNQGFNSSNWNPKKSPINSLKQNEMELMINMILAMNQCFPDYDFSSLTPADFHHVSNLTSVYDTINYNLSFVVEKVFPGFLQEFWDAVQDAISLDDVDIYSYESGSSSDPYNAENCLFSFDYFFHDKKRQRFLFISSITKSKARNYYNDDEDEEEENGFDGIFKKEVFAAYDDTYDDLESLTSYSPPT